jgi:hypothetical protein
MARQHTLGNRLGLDLLFFLEDFIMPFVLSGNGWAAAGMLRVLETLKYSTQAPNLVDQRADLEDWIMEILNGSLKYQVQYILYAGLIISH